MAWIPSVCLLVLCVLAQGALCQTATPSSLTDSYTPAGLEPGTPAHSYPLSGFDNISYFSGSLNFRLPLLRVGGRGQAGYTLMLPIEGRFNLLTVTADDRGPYTFTPDYYQVEDIGVLVAYRPVALFART